MTGGNIRYNTVLLALLKPVLVVTAIHSTRCISSVVIALTATTKTVLANLGATMTVTAKVTEKNFIVVVL